MVQDMCRPALAAATSVARPHQRHAIQLGAHGPTVTISTHRHDVFLKRLVAREMSKDVYRLLNHSRFDRGGVALDIGSHVGTVALLLAKLHPELEAVHAFEPSPTNYFFLLQNIRTNGLAGRVLPHPFALAAEDGTRAFETSVADTTGGRLTDFGGTYGGAEHRSTISVRTVAMREFVRACLPPSPARMRFVKLDCEGCEYELVPGMAHFFTARVERLAGELHGSQVLSMRARGQATRREHTNESALHERIARTHKLLLEVRQREATERHAPSEDVVITLEAPSQQSRGAGSSSSVLLITTCIYVASVCVLFLRRATRAQSSLQSSSSYSCPVCVS